MLFYTTLVLQTMRSKCTPVNMRAAAMTAFESTVNAWPDPSLSQAFLGVLLENTAIFLSYYLWEISKYHTSITQNAPCSQQLWPDLKHGLTTMATCSRRQHINSFLACTPVFSFFLKMEMWLPIKRPRRICQQKHCRCHCNQTPTLLSIWHNYQTFLRKTECSEIGFTFCFPFRPF